MNKEEQFEKYMELLIEWNKKMNLTAITEPKEIKLKHFKDSLTILKHIKPGSKLIDIGTGAGFPGIPLKIMEPSLEITLVDSLNKRILFLEEAINKLELKNIKAIHARAEEIGKEPEYREQYDVVVSRAVANMRVLAEYTLPLIKVGGMAIYMKGPNIEEELEEAKTTIKTLGGKITKIDSFTLEGSDLARTNIIIEKKQKTPNKYPRKNKEIKSKKI